MAALVATMLRTLGIRDICEAVNVTRAMTALKGRAFDVLVIDDGFRGQSVEFVQKLRAKQDCRNRHIPIIMMSSLPDAAAIARARDGGVNEFLRKPFSVKHIEARLKTIFNVPRDFIAVESYNGPDRRRRIAGFDGEDRRRSQHAASLDPAD